MLDSEAIPMQVGTSSYWRGGDMSPRAAVVACFLTPPSAYNYPNGSGEVPDNPAHSNGGKKTIKAWLDVAACIPVIKLK